MSLKNLISSPLEAGQSVLDAHRLPSHLDAALEYTARRLARKALSIDLVVVRRLHQLPHVTAVAETAGAYRASPSSAERPSSSLRSLPSTIADAQEVDAITGFSSSSSSFLPSRPPPAAPSHAPLPSCPLPSPPASGSRFTFAIKNLVRANTLPSLVSPQSASFSSSSSASVSPTFSSFSLSSSSSVPAVALSSSTENCDGPKRDRKCGDKNGGSRWLFSPIRSLSSASAASSCASIPSTPATPLTPALTIDSSPSRTAATDKTTSTMTAPSVSGQSGISRVSNTNTASAPSSSFGIRFVHADDLPRAHQRVLCQTLEKTARKFHLGSNWFGPSVDASVLGLPGNLVSRSIDQNQILFAAPGLVLRSLDHLYTFKAALCSYAQTGDHYRLEDAVDELRRYILAQGGRQHGRRRLAKRELLRQYPSLLCFSESHLTDVGRMYSRAYGGPEHECGIEADGLSLSPPLAIDTLAAASEVHDTTESQAMEADGTRADEREEKNMDDAAAFSACEGSEQHGDEEQTTPTATSVEDAVLDSLAWTSFLNISPSTSPLPILGMTAARRRRSAIRLEEESHKASSSASSPSLPSLSPSLSSFLSADEADRQVGLDVEVLSEEVAFGSESPVLGTVKFSFPVLSTDNMTHEPLNTVPIPSQDVAATQTEEPLPTTSNELVLDQVKEKGHGDRETENTVILRPASTKAFLTSPAKAASPQKLLPVLKLKTTFASRSSSKKPANKDDVLLPSVSESDSAISSANGKNTDEGEKEEEEEEEEEEQLTARPVSCVRKTGCFFFGAASIGEILQDGAASQSPDDPSETGPTPPKDYDDISPITRSEWGFLMGDQMGRQVTVTTF